MNDLTFYYTGCSPALSAAAALLARKGCNVTDRPDGKVTHLLLPVPSFEAKGIIKGGSALTDVLTQLSKDIVIMGGGLNDNSIRNYRHIDFLQDPLYLAENAAITAHCAVKLALHQLPATMQGTPVLIIGWGRIGKCLASLLKSMGANVTVAAVLEADRAMLRALGYEAEDPAALSYSLMRYRVIFNTAPAPVIGPKQAEFCRPDCLKIDLASQPGIAGDDVIWARGLPGKEAPETSGELIARTVIRLARNKE